MLLGFIWKQGDYQKVTHVLEGLRGAALSPAASVVLYQFGRHLANPMEEPILDQHSCRARPLLTKGFSNWSSPDEFDTQLSGDSYGTALFRGTSQSKTRLGVQHLETYKRWWIDEIKPITLLTATKGWHRFN